MQIQIRPFRDVLWVVEIRYDDGYLRNIGTYDTKLAAINFISMLQTAEVKEVHEFVD